MAASLQTIDVLEALILQIRGTRVLLDEHLSSIYGVSTKQLNQQLKRNIRRFPSDFAFQLTAEEYAAIRSQNVTASKRRALNQERQLR